MRRLAILGASGHGKVVADIALQTGWDEVVFFDDAWPRVTTIEHWTVAGDSEALIRTVATYDGVAVAIGNNAARLSKLGLLRDAKGHLVTIVHPKSVVSPLSHLGEANVVGAGAVISAFARLGLGCIVNTSAIVGHDCVVESGVHVAPGAVVAGAASIGAMTWIGLNASVRQGVRVGREVTVGAGAVVVKDVPDGVTVVGVPARPINGGGGAG